MEKFSLHLKQHLPKKPLTIYFLFAFLAVALLPPTAYAQTVEGRELNWYTEVPSGWWGGNFYQIETMIQNTGDRRIRSLLKSIQPAARGKEAAFFHLQDAYKVSQRNPSFSTRTLTEIIVTFRNNPDEKELSSLDWNQTWEAFPILLKIDYPGAEVDLVSQNSFGVGQYTAREAVFRIRPASGGTLYESMIVFPMASVGQLIFGLKVDSSQHNNRLAEMRQMVQMIRFK
jgi:hypothetical protein